MSASLTPLHPASSPHMTLIIIITIIITVIYDGAGDHGEDVLPVMVVAALRGHALVPAQRVLPGEAAVVGGGRPRHQHQDQTQRRGHRLQHHNLKQSGCRGLRLMSSYNSALHPLELTEFK